MNPKIIIIGAGPAGLYLAFLLAKSKKNVTVLEENKDLGKPVHCTGIVTSEIEDFLDIPNSLIQNTITNVELTAGKKKILFPLKEPNYVLDREKFDRHLAKKAEDAGAKIKKDRKVIRVRKRANDYMIFTEKESFETDIVVGAEGWNSITAKWLGLRINKEVMPGLQVIAKKPLKDKYKVRFWFCNNCIKWIVPISETTSKIGIAGGMIKIKDLDEFLWELNIQKADCKEYFGGFIPIFTYFGKRSMQNAYLIGDSAGFVKATTGGGIIPALKSARCCCDAIMLQKNYEKLWKKHLLMEMILHKKINRAIAKMDEKALEALFIENIRLLSKESRDNVSKWMLKPIMNPKNWRLFRYFF